jgi:nitroimidazol reductase NimA-like FMN-containing flavoprotein (pyridoxamine 5'-phosphate oxidase superfamily)
VNHVFDSEHGCVVFPTSPGTKLHAALHWPWVAFEVDGIDPDGNGAWSVMVVGRAEEVEDRDDVARLADQRHVLWAAGESARWIRVVPTNITGRHISAKEL